MKKFFGTLIGYDIEVLNASNESYIGIKGRVVDETRNMVVVRLDNGRVVKIVKRGTYFRVMLNDNRVLEIEGNKLIGNIIKRVIRL
jgi:ribonuclease P protein subunit POP4